MTEHSKHRHIFVVIRMDFYDGVTPSSDSVVATKAYFSQKACEDERDRLLALNPDSIYFIRVARLVDCHESNG